MGSPAGLQCLPGQIRAVQGQEPPDAGVFKLEETGHFFIVGQMNHLCLQGTEDPQQHVEKMDADIRCHAARLGDVPFPGNVVPATAGGDIGQLDVILFRGLFLGDLFF